MLPAATLLLALVLSGVLLGAAGASPARTAAPPAAAVTDGAKPAPAAAARKPAPTRAAAKGEIERGKTARHEPRGLDLLLLLLGSSGRR
jgi:hypothetical protein